MIETREADERVEEIAAIGWGFDFVTVSNDVRLLAGAAQASVAEVRKLLGEAVAADKGGPGGY